MKKKVGASESALRRRADRKGYRLVKSRQTGEYGLSDLERGGMIFGWDFDATLEEIVAYLSDDEPATKPKPKPKPKLKVARGALRRAIDSGRMPPPPGYHGPSR
jgi:hypothetical protein